MDENKIIIYTSTDGKTKIDVKLEDETLWLTQAQMCELYQSSRTNVLEHIQHIYEEGELQEEATCRKFRQVRQEGNRSVTREVACYNLDMIIALGYRVKSIIATRFRHLPNNLFVATNEFAHRNERIARTTNDLFVATNELQR